MCPRDYSLGVLLFKTCYHKPTVIRNGHSSRPGRTHQKCWVGHGRTQLSRHCLTIGSENSFWILYKAHLWMTQGWHLLIPSIIATHLSSHPALHDHLSQFCSTPGLFITNYRGHRHLWWALIAAFSSTCIQRNQSSELLLPHLPVCIARHETPSSTSWDVQCQIRTNSVCRDTYHSCLIAQTTAILTQDT